MFSSDGEALIHGNSEAAAPGSLSSRCDSCMDPVTEKRERLETGMNRIERGREICAGAIRSDAHTLMIRCVRLLLAIGSESGAGFLPYDVAAVYVPRGSLGARKGAEDEEAWSRLSGWGNG